MNNRKPQNSILVLATLGVYLGLVLVGATPQVLAQQKLESTVSFQRDEGFACPNNALINGERAEDINPFDYDLANRIRELLESTKIRLEFLRLNEPEVLKANSFFFNQFSFAPYINKKGKLVEDEWGDKSSEWASAAHAGQIAELESLFLTPLADCTKPARQKYLITSIHLEINDNGLKLEMIVAKTSQSRADQLANSIRELFENKSLTSNEGAIRWIYKNTEIEARNNQVFIVTRLPRAGLDSLLASSAK